MRIKTLVILISVILSAPLFTFADGGMIVWPPKVHLDQTAQNAIVAWNGEQEIIILSNDIKSDVKATALRMVPLPSNPSEIKEGSFETFEKLVEIINEKIARIQTPGYGKGLAEGTDAGVEITFHKKIGAHDVTVVKVNDLDYFLNWIKDFADGKGLEVKEISKQFRNGVKNYLKRDIKHFVFDVIEAGETKESIKPLIYKFDADYLYYPLLISGISEIGESRAEIHVFLITENSVSEAPFRWNLGYSEVELTQEELNEISEDIAELFEAEVKVRKFNFYNELQKLKKDIIVYPQIWKKHLDAGSRGEDVKCLQKILINEGVWESEVGSTGYFGQITKNALAKFQDKYNYEILRPIGLEKGTGYFGSKTMEYLKKSSVEFSPKEIPLKAKWIRNLNLGISGDDVKKLQEILIAEEVWQRPDIGATGYFGSITKAAVIKFQEKYAAEILEPLGLKNGTGYFGPSTRAYLEKITE